MATHLRWSTKPRGINSIVSILLSGRSNRFHGFLRIIEPTNHHFTLCGLADMFRTIFNLIGKKCKPSRPLNGIHYKQINKNGDQIAKTRTWNNEACQRSLIRNGCIREDEGSSR